eukprot:8309563-Pyramimonas_sp.AAC.1
MTPAVAPPTPSQHENVPNGLDPEMDALERRLRNIMATTIESMRHHHQHLIQGAGWTPPRSWSPGRLAAPQAQD